MHIAFIASVLLTFFATSGSLADSSKGPTNLSGWNTDGQTFLVWEHSTAGYPESHIYEIYASSEPILSFENAVLIGEVFSNNCWNYRLQDFIPNPEEARWVLPDGTRNGYKVKTGESYFVVTPHEPGERYYAVVGKGSEFMSRMNTTGPIEESAEPVDCHLQYRDTDVTIYAHWIDGNSDIESGREDYPIMGNEHANGLGFNFAVWEPEGGRPPGNLPLVIRLHGIAGDFLQEDVVEVATTLVPDGLFATFDDDLRTGPYPGVEIMTAWFGYADEFDRFSPPAYAPSDTAVVNNYTARRVWWETDWLIKNETINSQRISLTGNSLGGAGAILHTTLKSDVYASAMATVPVLMFGPWDEFYPIFGTNTQRLPTNLQGEPAVWDVFNTRWRIDQPHSDWPYVLLVNGKREDSWQNQTVPTFEDLDEARSGYALYWDERLHSDWEGAHFNPSEHLMPSYLTRYSKDESFPAFSNTDEHPWILGRQPEIGNGDPGDGDPWGTWGGYFEWRPSTIFDESTGWKCTIWITSESEYANDIPDVHNIMTDVTPRKLQNFTPEAGQLYRYKLVDIDNGDLLDSGTVEARADGSITVPDLTISKNPYRLSIDPASD